MRDYVNIHRMKSQRIISQLRLLDGGHLTLIENMGYDAGGGLWRFYAEHTTNADGITRMGSPFDFEKVSADVTDTQPITPDDVNTSEDTQS